MWRPGGGCEGGKGACFPRGWRGDRVEAAAAPGEPSAGPEGRAAASAAGRTGPPSGRPSRSGRLASAWLPAGGWEDGGQTGDIRGQTGKV